MPRTSLVIVMLAAFGADAGAKSEKTVHWSAEKIFPTAVRFLRIDEHVTIVDKDAANGYVIFDLPDEGKTYRGALEIVQVADDPPEVKLELRIEDRPSYMEEGMLERLEQKLHDELGQPPEASPKKPDKPADKPADKPSDQPQQ